MHGNRYSLAEQEGFGNVELCDCGSIHLRVGPVTVVLAPEAFTQTVQMVREASAALAASRLQVEAHTRPQAKCAMPN